jgi:hypothetical protein
VLFVLRVFEPFFGFDSWIIAYRQAVQIIIIIHHHRGAWGKLDKGIQAQL